MKKRIKFVPLFCIFAFVFSGCMSIFNTEYRSEEPYEDEYLEIKDDSSVQEVKNYQGMKNALMNLIDNAAEYGIIRTEKYRGIAEEDISKACFEVTREEPMGIFAVDYITHSVNRIVSYYEIEVYITYKRTAEEITNVVTIRSGTELQELLRSALREFEPSVAVMQVSTAIDSDAVEKYVKNIYRSNPMLLPVCPEVHVNTFRASESTIREINEIIFDYSYEPEQLSIMYEELYGYTLDFVDISNYGDAAFICHSVMECCIPVAEAEKNTAYEALLGSGKVGSEGYAMAVKMLCNASGIEAYVVEGRKNDKTHFWNIINVRGQYFHVDAYADDLAGREPEFLLDKSMSQLYSWDEDDYPACEERAE